MNDLNGIRGRIVKTVSRKVSPTNGDGRRSRQSIR